MISTIKELINQALNKMHHLFIILTFLCLFVTIFPMPESVSSHVIFQFIFPDTLLNNSNIELMLYGISFYGFLWLIFFAMMIIGHILPALFDNSIYDLKRILEKVAGLMVIGIEYGYVLMRMRKVSFESLISTLNETTHPILLILGFSIPMMLLTFMICEMIYVKEE